MTELEILQLQLDQLIIINENTAIIIDKLIGDITKISLIIAILIIIYFVSLFKPSDM